MKRLVVVGAGISGLAAAWAASRRAAEVPGGLDVVVLEREARVGGKVRSLREDSWCIEAGPTGYLDAEPVMKDLAAAAGLEPVPASRAAARRFVVRGGRLVEIKASPLALGRPGLLGPLGLLRIAAEPFVPRRTGGADESVWAFAARRLGRRVADRLISPMMLGIFAGDAQRLSLPAAFPRLAEIEAEHGSLIRGLIARRRKNPSRPKGGPSGPAGWLTSFGDGLESLPAALARQAGMTVRTGAKVQTLRRRPGGGFELIVDGDAEVLPADTVILTGEPWANAALLDELAPEAARALAAIPCPPVVVVALGYGPETLACVPTGFGALIPRTEGFRILGCLWDTHLFPGRSPAGHLLVRAMLGGSVDPAAADLDDAALEAGARDDLRRLLGITATPRLVRIVRWPRAIPQYELGHPERVKTIERSLAALPGLALAGNGLLGISFAKAAALGVQRGDEAVTGLVRAR